LSTCRLRAGRAPPGEGFVAIARPSFRAGHCTGHMWCCGAAPRDFGHGRLDLGCTHESRNP
jgi:hypothetical protein